MPSRTRALCVAAGQHTSSPLSTLCRYGKLPTCLEPLRSRLVASRKQQPMLSHGADVVPVVQAPRYTVLRSGWGGISFGPS